MPIQKSNKLTYLVAKKGQITMTTRHKEPGSDDWVYVNERVLTVTGKITSIKRIETKYGQNITPEIEVRIKDDVETFRLTFTEKSQFTQNFFARIASVDLTKDVTIGASGSDQNENVTFCWIKQNGQVVKKDPDFPRPVKDKRGDWQYSEMLDAVEDMLPDLQEKLGQPVELEEIPELGTEEEDLIPF